MRALARVVVGAAVLLGVRGPVAAQPEVPPADVEEEPARPPIEGVTVRPTKHSREITVEIPGERSGQNKLLLAGLGAITVIASGLAVYYHLDSRSLADEISASEPMGGVWSPAHEDVVDDNERSRTLATAGYAIGGGFLIALVITYIVTDPPAETQTIFTTIGARPIVAPTREGATVGAAWSF